jgi:hypothetical protein
MKLKITLALLILLNAGLVASQEPAEPPASSINLPAGLWREVPIDSSVTNHLGPRTIHQVTYYDDGSFAAVHRLNNKWYRIFVTKDSKIYCSVYITGLRRK